MSRNVAERRRTRDGLVLLPDGPLRFLPNWLLLRPLGFLPDRLRGLRRLPLASHLIRPSDVIKGTGGHAADSACLLILDAPGLFPGGLLFARPPDLLFAGALLLPEPLFITSALHLLLAGLLLLTDARLLRLLAFSLSLRLNGPHPLLLLGLALALDLLLALHLSLPLRLALLLGLPLSLRLPLLFSLSLAFLFLASALLLLLARSLLRLPLLLGLALALFARAALLLLARTLLLFLPGPLLLLALLALLLFALLLLALLPVALFGLPALLFLLLVLLAVGCLDVIKRTRGRRLGRRHWRQKRRPQRDAPPSPGLPFHRCSSAARNGGCTPSNVIHCLHIPDPRFAARFH